MTECDVLALSTVVSSEWAKCSQDTEELMFWGEFWTAVGTNLIMMADQRVRRENCIKKSKPQSESPVTPQPTPPETKPLKSGS